MSEISLTVLWERENFRLVKMDSGRLHFEVRASSTSEWFAAALNPYILEHIIELERDTHLSQQGMTDFVIGWLGIEEICPACSGRGTRGYGSTSTWHGGIGGQMMTGDICDKCWGSGDAKNPWLNLRILDRVLTDEQKKTLRQATAPPISGDPGHPPSSGT